MKYQGPNGRCIDQITQCGLIQKTLLYHLGMVNKPKEGLLWQRKLPSQEGVFHYGVHATLH